jgi:hypothetical protein
MFSDEDMKWLDGSTTQTDFLRHKGMLEGHHKVFTELCPEFTFTFEEYAWAMKTV